MFFIKLMKITGGVNFLTVFTLFYLYRDLKGAYIYLEGLIVLNSIMLLLLYIVSKNYSSKMKSLVIIIYMIYYIPSVIAIVFSPVIISIKVYDQIQKSKQIEFADINQNHGEP